jgi:hypothetical protein
LTGGTADLCDEFVRSNSYGSLPPRSRDEARAAACVTGRSDGALKRGAYTVEFN